MQILSKKLLCRIIDEPFTQPVYPTNEISSTLFDTEKFSAVASSRFGGSYDVKNLFNTLYASGGDNTGSNKIWECGSGSKNKNPWVKFTNPYPIKVTEIEFDFRVERAYRVPKGVTIYGGNDGENWVEILPYTTFTQERTLQTKEIDLPNYYYGYYLYFNGSGQTGDYGVTEVANLNITATYEVNE